MTRTGAGAVSCPHFDECGGCVYPHSDYARSIAEKEEHVRRLLAPHIAAQAASCVWEPLIHTADAFAYRNKMEFTFGDAQKGGALELGLHKRRRFHDIVSVPDCLIMDADFRRILRAVLSFFWPLYADGAISYYHRKRQEGYLRHLLVRKARHTGEILVDLVTTSRYDDVCAEDADTDLTRARKKKTEEEMLKDFADMLRACAFDGVLRGVLHTVNDRTADAVLDGGTEILYGSDFFTESLLGLSFTITPFSFFQTNTESAALLYDTVRRYVRLALSGETRDASAPDGPSPESTGARVTAGTVFDLYCGTGTITQLLSPVAKEVVGVELVEEAVAAARISTKENGITNCRFLAGDVLQVLDTLTEKPDLIVLDPPRAGVHPKALNRILSLGVAHIIYVSCKPESLSRDLPYFRTAGYQIKRAVCIDQFPFTAHVETVVLLSRENK